MPINIMEIGAMAPPSTETPVQRYGESSPSMGMDFKATLKTELHKSSKSFQKPEEAVENRIDSPKNEDRQEEKPKDISRNTQKDEIDVTQKDDLKTDEKQDQPDQDNSGKTDANNEANAAAAQAAATQQPAVKIENQAQTAENSQLMNGLASSEVGAIICEGAASADGKTINELPDQKAGPSENLSTKSLAKDNEVQNIPQASQTKDAGAFASVSDTVNSKPGLINKKAQSVDAGKAGNAEPIIDGDPSSAAAAANTNQTANLEQMTAKTTSQAQVLKPAVQKAEIENAEPIKEVNNKIDPASIPAAGNTDRMHGISSARETAEPARLAEAHATDIADQIVKNMQLLVKEGKTSLSVQLFPESLGKIELRVTGGSHGVGVTILADQSSTSKLMESQLNNLRTSLSQAGIQLSDLSVGQNHSNGQQTSQRNGNSISGNWMSNEKPAPGYEQAVHQSVRLADSVDYWV